MKNDSDVVVIRELYSYYFIKNIKNSIKIYNTKIFIKPNYITKDILLS